MSARSSILKKEIQDYLNNYYEHLNTPAVKALNSAAAKNGIPEIQISLGQAAFLQWIIRSFRTKNILEIGTLIGYSAYIMANASNNAHIITIEKNERFIPLAKEFWNSAGVSDRIELRLGLAEEIMKELVSSGHKFDLIFIDADKLNYDLYYERSLQLLNKQGIILIDNMFAFGRVNEKDFSTPEVDAIRLLNKKIRQDERIRNLLLPLGDGLTIIQKKESQ
jgi:predicted O-methyltransferase YrrM